MSGRVLYYFTSFVLFIIISGCVSETPGETAPTTTPVSTPGTGVEVLDAPENVKFGQSFKISWRANNPVEINISHTAVHFGPESRSEPLTVKSYPDLTIPQSGIIPAEFSANLVINSTGITYYRAHAIINGENYWSDEMIVTVSAPTIVGPIAINITSIPASVDGDSNFNITWKVSGGTPGDISHTAIHWGFRSGGENISDYPRISEVQTGKSPQQFSAELKAPAGGTAYYRAHAIVDGEHIYSKEYMIRTKGGY